MSQVLTNEHEYFPLQERIFHLGVTLSDYHNYLAKIISVIRSDRETKRGSATQALSDWGVDCGLIATAIELDDHAVWSVTSATNKSTSSTVRNASKKVSANKTISSSPQCVNGTKRRRKSKTTSTRIYAEYG